MIQNAKITGTSLSIGDHGCLSAWLYLEFESGGQGFGGYSLLSITPKMAPFSGCAGFFIVRCLQIADVLKWADLAGKIIRIDGDESRVTRIGHALRDDWFSPDQDLRAVAP